MARLLVYEINCVFHLWNEVFNGISKCNICNNDGIYVILYRSVLSSEET